MIDSHAHYDDRAYNDDRTELLLSMREKGITHIINSGDSEKSSRRSIELAKSYDFLYASIGVHPHNAKEFTSSTYENLLAMSSEPKVVAIGEIGLDYHYDNSPREKQKEVFATQMELSAEVGLPVVIHEREALSDCLDILKGQDFSRAGGMMHCFSGSVETAKIILNMGMYISIGGIVTFKNAVKAVETAKYVPSDRLLIETDCPYLAPHPHRGERNDSGLMRFTLEKIAQIRESSFDELDIITTENAKRFYRI